MNSLSHKLNYPQMTIFPEIKQKSSSNKAENRTNVIQYLQKVIKTKKKEPFLDFDVLRPAFSPFKGSIQGEFDDLNLRDHDDIILRSHDKSTRAGTNRNSTLGSSYIGNKSVNTNEYSKLTQNDLRSSRRGPTEFKDLMPKRNSPIGIGLAIPPNLNFYDEFLPQPEHIEYLKSKTKGESIASSRNEQISLFSQRNSQPNAQVHFFPEEFPPKEVKVYDYHKKFAPKYIKVGDATQRNQPVKVVNLLSVNGSDIPIRYKPKEIPKTKKTKETVDPSTQIYKLDKRTPIKLIDESLTLRPENNTLLTRSVERDRKAKKGKVSHTDHSEVKYEYTWEGKSISKVLLNKKSSEKMLPTDNDFSNSPSKYHTNEVSNSPTKYYNTDEYSPSKLSKVFRKKNQEVQRLEIISTKAVTNDPVLSALILKKTIRMSPRETIIPRADLPYQSNITIRKKTHRSEENHLHSHIGGGGINRIVEADTENDTIKGWDEEKHINNFNETEHNSFGLKF